MVEFAAQDFVKAAHIFGLLMADVEKQKSASEMNLCGDAISALLKHCNHLGLVVTHEHIVSMFEEAVKKDPKCIHCDPKWLADTKLPEKFPTSLKELQRAGNCYALGESTACVFHSMRALEPCLNSLAAYFQVPFAQENWQNVINNIEGKDSIAWTATQVPAQAGGRAVFRCGRIALVFC